MSDGCTALANDEMLRNLHVSASQLEESLIIVTVFGDKSTDSANEWARRAIQAWGEYICTEGFFRSPDRALAVGHIAALGDWLEGKMDYSQMWAVINDKLPLKNYDHALLKARHYVEAYSRPRPAQPVQTSSPQ